MRDQSKPDEILREIHTMVTALSTDTLPREFVKGIYHGQWIYAMYGLRNGTLRTYIPADYSYLELEILDEYGNRIWVRKFKTT